MKEVNIDISHHQSKSVGFFQNDFFDIVITVCDHAKKHCPLFLNCKTSVIFLHWPLKDPAQSQDPCIFRQVRNQIFAKFESTLNTYLI